MIKNKLLALATLGNDRRFTRGSVAAGAIFACSLALSAGFPATARADVTDELLQIMKAKGDITEKQYKELKARHEAEKAAAAKTATAAANLQSGATPVAIKRAKDGTDAPPPPPGSSKDGWGDVTYVTALPKGVGVRIGSVDVKVSGDISFFAAEDRPQGRFVEIDGGLLSSGIHNDANAIRAGLLPSSIQVGISTNQEGWDIAAFFGIYTGGNNIGVGAIPVDCPFNANCGGAPFGLGTAGVDFRQAYGTVGTATLGTIKFGRDIGLFGQDAILNDLTIFGAGTPQANFAPSNTTLGRIGIGYIYADFIPQFTYTSPDIHGFTASAGVFTPYNEFNSAGIDSLGNVVSADITGQDSPMVQGRLKYKGNFGATSCGLKDTNCGPGPITLTLSTSFVVQDHQVENRDLALGNINPVLFRAGDTFTSWGWDGFARLDWGPISLVGYGYTGSGLGSTALFFNGFSFNGQARDSSGGYAQGSYTFFDRLTVGGSWGTSVLDRVPGDSPFLFRSIESDIGFVRYKLTSWVNFQAEFVHTEERNQIGDKVNDDAVIFGTTFFW